MRTAGLTRPLIHNTQVAAVVLLLAQALPSGASAQPIEAVAVPRSQALTAHSEKLGRTYDLQVRLPPTYFRSSSAARRYPVLYLTDAAFNFQVASAVTQLPMNAGTIEEFIIVGLGYERGLDYVSSRVRDYTPMRNPEFERETGGAASYLEFIEQEVLPLVESRYRVDSERRALGGHSLGGLFAAYVLFRKPELFSHYLVSSPSFWFGDRAIFALERSYAEVHEDLAASVYMGIGGLEHPDRPGQLRPMNHMVNQLREMERVLASRSYPSLVLRATVIDGADHETVVPTIMMQALLWHFATDRRVPYEY